MSKRTLEELEGLAGIVSELSEERLPFKELTAIKAKIHKLAKKNDMKAITKLLKGLAKNDEKDFDEALAFLVSI